MQLRKATPDVSTARTQSDKPGQLMMESSVFGLFEGVGCDLYLVDVPSRDCCTYHHRRAVVELDFVSSLATKYHRFVNPRNEYLGEIITQNIFGISKLLKFWVN